MRMKSLVVAAIAAFSVTNAHAFGLGDLVSIGVQVGSKVVHSAGSAVADKIKDSMRDPEAEAAKKREEEQRIAQQFQKAAEEIEARPGLTSLQRERLVLMLQKQYEQAQAIRGFVEAAEARQREERDKIFTTAGFMGVVGEAAMNTPTVVMAKADMMVQAGIPQAKSRAAIAQADALMATGIPQAKGKLAMAQADAVMKAGTPQAGTKLAMAQADAMAGNGISPGTNQALAEAVAQAKEQNNNAPQDATAPETAATAIPETQVAQTGDAFSPDLGKKLYVDFVGTPTKTAELRRLLADRGHLLIDKPEEADVAYRIEGEYTVVETKQYDGLVKDVGGLLENPAQPIPQPEKKTMGSINLGLSRLMVGLATAQGAKVPANAAPVEQTSFKQEVLLVIARQPKDGKETRFSVRKTMDVQELRGVAMSREAVEELLKSLGLEV